MNKNIEELKKVNREYFNSAKLKVIFCYLIPILEDFEKRLKNIEIELGIYTEEEVKKIKVGGTDPD